MDCRSKPTQSSAFDCSCLSLIIWTKSANQLIQSDGTQGRYSELLCDDVVGKTKVTAILFNKSRLKISRRPFFVGKCRCFQGCEDHKRCIRQRSIILSALPGLQNSGTKITYSCSVPCLVVKWRNNVAGQVPGGGALTALSSCSTCSVVSST